MVVQAFMLTTYFQVNYATRRPLHIELVTTIMTEFNLYVTCITLECVASHVTHACIFWATSQTLKSSTRPPRKYVSYSHENDNNTSYLYGVSFVFCLYTNTIYSIAQNGNLHYNRSLDGGPKVIRINFPASNLLRFGYIILSARQKPSSRARGKLIPTTTRRAHRRPFT